MSSAQPPRPTAGRSEHRTPRRVAEPEQQTAIQDADALTEIPRRAHGGLWSLGIAAIGIVFGDIGTSPLYSMQTVFSIEHNTVQPTPGDVLGVISMVFWAVTIVVSIKYVALVMRADNEGEGGILALVALLRERLGKRTRLASGALMLGIIGAALFYGDSVITPAISVMSAMEGLVLVNPALEELVLPISIVILTVLFFIQRWGTSVVGRAFGPVMLLWFATLAAMGIPEIIRYPDILVALSPTYAFEFLLEHPFVAFIAMGAVVLAITGAEALYADMGHFGARPIRMSWFFVVFPALLLNYLGQGAMILHDPTTIDNPFFHLAPAWARLPLVILAALATVIASQAVISGAFSVSRQATRLGILPRLLVRHTSKSEGGQIYVPAVNWILYVGVLALIGIFQSSANLANAYGLAVTGTLVLTTLLFLFLAKHVWGWGPLRLLLVTALIGGLELVFLAANLTKLFAGGWLPLVIAGSVIVLMMTWLWGSKILATRRVVIEGPLEDFVTKVRGLKVPRVPGVAVFPHTNGTTTPLALRQNVAFNQVLHEHVIIATIVNENVPHIRHVERITVNELGSAEDGIVHIACRVGFNDSQDVPKALALAIGRTKELEISEAQALYFLSTLRLSLAGSKSIKSWRKQLFLWLSDRAASRVDTLHLPRERTVVMGATMDF